MAIQKVMCRLKRICPAFILEIYEIIIVKLNLKIETPKVYKQQKFHGHPILLTSVNQMQNHS